MDPLNALAEDVVRAQARHHPAWATQVGIRDHDARLQASSREAVLEELAEVEALLALARALPASVERDALVTRLVVEAFDLREVRAWARNPDLAGEFFDHVFSLLVAPHLSDEERLAGLAGRLEGVEAFFEDAWPRFEAPEVPPMWVEGALQTVEAGPEFLAAVRELVDAADAPPVLAARLDAALARAEAVLARHKRWLEALHEHAGGSPALGRDRFARLMVLRAVPETPDELAALGVELSDRFRRGMADAAGLVVAEAGHRVDAAGDLVAEALAVLRSDHPATFEGVLDLYRASIEDARRFVVERGVATPTDVPLEVRETPPFLRHLIPFAAYIGPPRFAHPRRGTYLVTPKADLGAFPRPDVRNTTVHEAWPGHHLQLSVATEEAGLAAWLCDSVDLIEGWALYCEAIMGEHGYTATPAERFVRARDALWRALRIVLDVGLHVGEIMPTDAVAMLSRELGMARAEAEAEVLRYTQSPGYNLSYMYGRIRLERLRERYLESGGTERAFHDAVLRAGSLPVTLLDRALLSASDMRQT